MSRIPDAKVRAKKRAAQTQTIPCCICEQQHPKNSTTGRMAEHSRQGRRCLGGDIPFDKHTEKPPGKLYIGAFPQRDPWPNRARAIQIAQGYLPQAAIDAGAAEPAEADHHPLWWVEQMLFALYRRDLQADIDAMQRRPRLVERGVRA